MLQSGSFQNFFGEGWRESKSEIFGRGIDKMMSLDRIGPQFSPFLKKTFP